MHWLYTLQFIEIHQNRLMISLNIFCWSIWQWLLWRYNCVIIMQLRICF